MSLIVNEIFHSLQGESTHAGLPCVFVRLTGCNMRCIYCDTRYAYDEGRAMPIPDILNCVGAFDCGMVEITGGEPLIQSETPELITCLLQKKYRVLIETNGSFDIRMTDSQCVRILDIKCPGSGEHETCDLKNLGRLTAKDQVKFVISDRRDYKYARNLLDRVSSDVPFGNLLFSPVQTTLEPAKLAAWMLEDHLKARLHLQLHKVIWPDIERGV